MYNNVTLTDKKIMEMAVSNGSGLAYIGVDFQFFLKNLDDWMDRVFT